MIDVSITVSKAKASFDPFDPKSVEVGAKVPLLSIRRPRDLPPTLADRQRAIVESVAALVRLVDWTREDTTGTSRHLSRVFPGGEARDRRREPGRRSRF
jgi:hypothetical protein